MSNAFAKAVAEIMRGSGLERFTVVHQRFYGVGRFGSGKFVAVGLSTLDNRHSKIILAEIGVDIEHSFGFFNRFPSGCVYCMSLLPEEFP